MIGYNQKLGKTNTNERSCAYDEFDWIFRGGTCAVFLWCSLGADLSAAAQSEAKADGFWMIYKNRCALWAHRFFNGICRGELCSPVF